MHDISVQDFVHFAKRYVDMETEEIRKIADKLKTEGYVEILEGVDKTDLIFEHTKKVTPEMLDEKTDNLAKYGLKEPKDESWRK